jgi:hypothetical protein
MDAILQSRLQSLVKSEFWDEFVRFAATGKASPGFLAYLDVDKDCQTAVDAYLDAQSAELRSVLAELDDKGSAPQSTARPNKVTQRPTRWNSPLVAIALVFVGFGLLFNGLVGQSRIRHLQDQVVQRDNSLRSFEDEAESSRSNVTTLQAALATTTSERDELRGNVTAQSKRASALQEKLTHSEMEAKGHANRAEALEKALGKVQEELKQRENALNTKEDELVKLRAENIRLEKQVAASDATWLAAAAMYSSLRNEPFPKKNMLSRLLPEGFRERVPYVVFQADLEGRNTGEWSKLLAGFKADGVTGRVATAEAECWASGKPDHLLALMADAEQLLLEVASKGVEFNTLIVQRRMARDATVRFYRDHSKVVLTRLQEDLGRKGPTATTAAAVLAEIGPDAKGQLPALHGALKEAKAGYEQDIISYAIRKIAGSAGVP